MTGPANWRDEAACRDADPDLFFPTGPAQARCLAWALDHGVTDGVWGGTTEDERRTIWHLTRMLEIT